MRELAGYDRLTRRITAGFRETPNARGLLMLGSAAAPERRDEWSDHDFFAIVGDGFDSANRSALDWLPDPEHIVAVAREGEIGFAVVYRDGHLLEFAVATLDELSAAGVDRFRVEFGDEAVHRFATDAQARSRSAPGVVDASNEARLIYVKLLVGYGRARRGERVTAGLFVRSWAVGHFLRALRARVRPDGIVPQGDPLDPSRRLEADHPAIARALDRLVEQPTELAASGLAQLARDVLEPQWEAFPHDLADLVQAFMARE